MYQPRQDDYISNFDLTSLAFADLIVSEINADPSTIEPAKEEPKLAPFARIRCICGNNDVGGELIQCSECQSYLHKECVELPNKRTTQYRCPFCKLQQDGTDPFRELKMWIEEKDNEIKSIHNLLTEACKLDHTVHELTNESYKSPPSHMNMRTANLPYLKQTLNKNLQEAIERIRNLSNS